MFNTLSGKALTSRFTGGCRRGVWSGSFRCAAPPRCGQSLSRGTTPSEPPVRGKRDLLDAHFGVLEELIAALLQRFASFVKPNRLRRSATAPFSS